MARHQCGQVMSEVQPASCRVCNNTLALHQLPETQIQPWGEEGEGSLEHELNESSC